MKVLITGGAGKIGKKLINVLNKRDLSIRILDKKNIIDLSDKIEFVFGDLFNHDGLKKALKGIDVVVHLAAVTHSNHKEDYWRVNVEGTNNLINSAREAKVKRFIFISTRAISKDGGAYSQSKLSAEKIVKKSKIDWIILRPAEIYGIEHGMIDQLIKLVRKSYIVPVIDSKELLLSPIHIDDVIDVLEKVILYGNLTNKIYTLSGSESFSFKDVIEQICIVFKLKRLNIYFPLFLLKLIFKILNFIPGKSFLVPDQLPRLLSHKSADISLAEKDLDFKPKKFKQGLSLLN